MPDIKWVCSGVVAAIRSGLVAEFFVSDLGSIVAAQAQLRLPPEIFL